MLYGKKIINLDDSGINYFTTSDFHFYHKNACSMGEYRIWDKVDDMNAALIKHWNETVGKNDVVIFLGDFSFKSIGATQEIIDQLNGKIVFVLGNHDKALRKMVNVEKYDYLEFRYNGTKIICSHFPLACWNFEGHGSVHFFGHCHGQYRGIGRCMDVGYDVEGKIFRLDDVIERMMKKRINCVDGHQKD